MKSAVRTVILEQKVVNALNGGMDSCASSTPVMTAIDISSSAVNLYVKILKKVCSIVFEKMAHAVLMKEDEEEKGGKKDGKRKRDKRDSD